MAVEMRILVVEDAGQKVYISHPQMSAKTGATRMVFIIVRRIDKHNDCISESEVIVSHKLEHWVSTSFDELCQ